MLRPATPLTILVFAAFVLLLISVISTPIVKGIPLAAYGGVDFGVFGYCEPEGCSPIEIGYSTESLFNPEQAASFTIAPSTRSTLSRILIVHPVAALFTLVLAGMSAAAHFHKPSHSPRFLMATFILSLATLVLSLLSFLIDVLLFVPHMAWGSYIVLAATILIAASGIVSCAMRRTIVARKARKRRIAENAEMNGENYYNRQGTVPALAPTTGNTTLVSSNANGNVDKLPAFATFEMAKKDTEPPSDDRIPLTNRSPSEPPPGMAMSDGYRGQGAPPRDQYGNVVQPMPPSSYGSRSRDPSVEPSLNRQYSDNSMNSRGRGMPPGGYRGRGGYPPNGRGGYGQPRGGYGPQRGGGYGPPRGGYGGPGRGGMNEMAGGMAAGAVMRGGRGPPPNYARGPSPGSDYGRRPSNPEQAGYGGDAYRGPQQPPGGYVPYRPDDRESLARAESPPPMPGLDATGPVGQAVEMDATTGSPSHTPAGYGQFGSIRESDGDVAGMVGLQQQKLAKHETISDSSRYSTDEYVPPRQGWADQGRSSPLNPSQNPVELSTQAGTGHKRTSSGDHYYEDVDPRFAEPLPAKSSMLPPPLNAGYGSNDSRNNLRIQPVGGLDGQSSYEDLQSGSRSPAESDRSNFTSVSQRGINPRWAGPGQQGYGPMPNRRPVAPQQQQRDLLLNTNPDFQLPGNRGGRGAPRGGRGGPGGMTPNSAYPGGAL